MNNLIPLSQNNLRKLKNKIKIPAYDRAAIKTGIVHIGVGGFHRAHQAYFTNQLQERFGAPDWGICGVGLREGDRKIYDIFKKQDSLYTLIIKHPNGDVDSEVVGAIVDFELGVDNSQSVIDRLANAETKIVSLTITEGGYNFNAATGEFNFENKDIQHELKNPQEPKTVYGFLTAALRKRRDKNIPAFTIMSCDNIEHNGDVARNMVLAFAKRQDSELAEWIATQVCFPNSMVDRITPVTTTADIEYLSDTFSLKDEWPVTCEPFIQWVVEDNFSNGRPDLEKVGVQFVPDVKPYEKMKLRLLNAGHSVLGILGSIHGHQTINACMEDPLFVSYLRTFMDTEASPVLDEVKGINLSDYKDSLEERFANPNIKDSVARICSESSAKLPKFLIATIHENLAAGGNITLATLVIVAWCYYHDKTVDENGNSLEIIDAQTNKLHEAAKRTGKDSLAFIKRKSLFGNLAHNERFTSTYSKLVKEVYKTNNIKVIMKQLLTEG
ncbi:UNVERIFIED_CONTAM: hypothetical protein GTU68_062377 [Idotea baltica]|nr:hypothetical protein [Idotea baltica]